METGESLLFRVGVGDERVNHEVAVKSARQSGRSDMIFVEDGDIHMLEGWFGGLGVVDVEGRHCSVAQGLVRVDGRTMGTCLYTAHASLIQCDGPLMNSRIFSAAG